MRQSFTISMIALIFITLGCGGGAAGGGLPGSGASPFSGSVSTAFAAGISHIDGKYRFTQNNYLLEGAQKISALAGPGQGIAQSQDRLNAEENEFYQLTGYLYSRFSGSEKTFVLKNWETDGFAFLGSTTGDIPQNVAGDLIAWLSAPQRGVTRARNEAHDSSVLVLNAAEVNRVPDYAQNGLRRVINAVVPRGNADMLTYSSYDAMVYGSGAQSVQQSLTQALQTIEELAPDPQGLGNRRILISQYGRFEKEQPGDTWRADAVLSTAENAGLYGAFFWNLNDNECKRNGHYAPVAHSQMLGRHDNWRGRKPTTPNRCAVPRALDHSSGWNYQLGARCDQELLVAPRGHDGGPGDRVHSTHDGAPSELFAWAGGFPRLDAFVPRGPG